MEYHSFLFLSINRFKTCNSEWFPSPYGVSFILIFIVQMEYTRYYLVMVSVSLWSIIHSYFSLINYHFMLELRVSVSLWSIIHSYPMVKKVFYCNMFLECYRVIFLFLKFFYLFQLKASLTPHFLYIV